jgi:hypothetical protein
MKKRRMPLWTPTWLLLAACWIGLSGCHGEPTAREPYETGSSEATMTFPAIDQAAPADFQTASFGLG